MSLTTGCDVAGTLFGSIVASSMASLRSAAHAAMPSVGSTDGGAGAAGAARKATSTAAMIPKKNERRG